MAFKAASIVMAPGVDPGRHRASIKTDTLEFTAVLVELFNFDQAADVAQELVRDEGIQAVLLCPGFTHEAVAKIKNAVGERVAVNVARGDVPGTMLTAEFLGREGWFPQEN